MDKSYTVPSRLRYPLSLLLLIATLTINLGGCLSPGQGKPEIATQTEAEGNDEEGPWEEQWEEGDAEAMEEEAMYEELYALLREDGPATDTPSRERRYVTDLQDFFSALGNDRELILTMDTLNLTDKRIKAFFEGRQARQREEGDAHALFENGELVLEGYRNLAITSAKNTQIVVDTHYQNVLTFRNVQDVELSNLNLYHRVEVGCDAGVLAFYRSKRITIRGCEMNGSGNVGLLLEGVQQAKVEGSKLYNNSENAFSIENSQNVEIRECQVYENPCGALIWLRNSTCMLEQTSFTDNPATSFYEAVLDGQAAEILLVGCSFRGNTFEKGNSDDYFRAMNGSTLPSTWTERGMVYALLEADASQNVNRLEEWMGEKVFRYFDWWDGTSRPSRRAAFLKAFDERAGRFLRKRNEVLEVNSFSDDAPPEARLVQSSSTEKDFYLIQRVEYQVRIQWAAGWEEAFQDPYTHPQVAKVEVLKRRELPPVQLNLSEVEGLDDPTIAEALKGYRHRMMAALHTAYYEGLSFEKAMRVADELSRPQYNTILAYRQTEGAASENDQKKMVKYWTGTRPPRSSPSSGMPHARRHTIM
ncbi:MAG: hypothetical protein CSA07_00910 [Bacteroidia bacterium]|nr:MAG: hypothetical protein CSA07_00910 [Bacteroidia bacterium]